MRRFLRVLRGLSELVLILALLTSFMNDWFPNWITENVKKTMPFAVLFWGAVVWFIFASLRNHQAAKRLTAAGNRLEDASQRLETKCTDAATAHTSGCETHLQELRAEHDDLVKSLAAHADGLSRTTNDTLREVVAEAKGLIRMAQHQINLVETLQNLPANKGIAATKAFLVTKDEAAEQEARQIPGTTVLILNPSSKIEATEIRDPDQGKGGEARIPFAELVRRNVVRGVNYVFLLSDSDHAEGKQIERVLAVPADAKSRVLIKSVPEDNLATAAGLGPIRALVDTLMTVTVVIYEFGNTTSCQVLLIPAEFFAQYSLRVPGNQAGKIHQAAMNYLQGRKWYKERNLQ